MEVMGCTKAQYEQQIKEWLENYEKQEKIAKQKALENISNWISKGKTLIYPEKYAEWEKTVQSYADGIFHGSEIELALEIMEILKNGETIEEVLNIFDEQKISGMAKSIVMNILYNFSSRGLKFMEATDYEKTSAENEQLIEVEKEENIQLPQTNNIKLKKYRKHI